MRITAVLLVLVLSVATARTLACELICATSGPPQQQSESCHEDTDLGALATISATHACDHGAATLTFAPGKVGSVGRMAFSPLVASAAAIVIVRRSTCYDVAALGVHPRPNTTAPFTLRI